MQMHKHLGPIIAGSLSQNTSCHNTINQWPFSIAPCDIELELRERFVTGHLGTLTRAEVDGILAHRALLWKPTVVQRHAGSHILRSYIHAQTACIKHRLLASATLITLCASSIDYTSTSIRLAFPTHRWRPARRSQNSQCPSSPLFSTPAPRTMSMMAQERPQETTMASYRLPKRPLAARARTECRQEPSTFQMSSQTH